MTVSDPVAEWGYVTPRFPQGITSSALVREEAVVQRETAIVWFALNFQPYDLTKGGTYFGFSGQGPNVAGFNQAPFAPDQLDALTPLREEFMDIIPDHVLRATADSLVGSWMWIDWPLSPVGSMAVTANLLTTLDELRRRIEALTPAQGGIGNNGPSDDFPLTSDEQSKAVSAITQLEAVAPGAVGSDRATIERHTDTLRSYASKLGAWIIKAVAGGAAKEAGVELWKICHPHIGIWRAAGEALKLLHSLLTP